MKSLRVDQDKVVDYLLNPMKSRGKAAFFLKMGFSPDKWEELANALKFQAASNAVVLEVESQYGKRYSIDGELETPDRRFPPPRIRTVWIAEPDSVEWRLITAHPA